MQYEAIFYYKTESGKEVDFVAQWSNGKLDLYQVCLDMSDEKTKQREISALVEVAATLKVERCYIITSEMSDTLQYDALTITVVPYWHWAITVNNSGFNS